MKKKVAEKRQYLAAATIQKMWRGLMTRLWYRRVHNVRDKACRMIQKNWKIFFAIIVRPRRERFEQGQVINFVQDVCRGYLARKLVIRERLAQKCESTLAHIKFMKYYKEK